MIIIPNLKWIISHYLVDDGGRICFSSEDFTTLFFTKTYYDPTFTQDTIAVSWQKMEDSDIAVNTPAGSFLTSNCRTTFRMYPGHDALGKVRYVHRRYARGIGIVSETMPFYEARPRYRERRLLRYHLK